MCVCRTQLPTCTALSDCVHAHYCCKMLLAVTTTLRLTEAALRLPAIVNGAEGTIALLVDAVIDARELILQGIGQLTRRIRGVVGGALRADGRPLFLIDVAELERAARSSVQMVSSSALRRRLAVERTRVLVVDDALSVRRSMQQLLGDAGYGINPLEASLTFADGSGNA